MIKNNPALIAIFTVIILICLFIFNVNYYQANRAFSLQAQNFIHGMVDIPTVSDTVDLNGQSYWPQGPFPSVLLIPFQLVFKTLFTQIEMQLILIIILGILLYKLARLKTFSKEDSFFLMWVFMFGSIIIGLITNPGSYYFAEVVSVTLLSALLFEMESKKRPLILGILEACLIATRPPAGFIIFTLVPFLFFSTTSNKEKIKKLLLFLAPVVVTTLILLWFNYIRFGNFFDNGYFTNNIGSHYGAFRDIGLLSLNHLPTNIYYYFLASVIPVTKELAKHLIFPYLTYDPWGLSFFIVSPFFIYAFRSLKMSSVYIKSLWLIVLITLLFSLLYYAPGFYQFGPRYTADFLPVLFLLLLYSLQTRKLTTKQKIFIIFSSFINTYLLASRVLVEQNLI